MAKRQLPSPEVIRQLLRYEPETGKLFWKERGPEWFKSGSRCAADSARSWNRKFAGKEALYAIGSVGYPQGKVLNINCRAHRVAWAIHYGFWPTEHVDHVNGNRTDNRLVNLRQATRSENMCNRSAPSDNTSGLKGVYWNAREKKWHVQLSFEGKRKSVGYFKDKGKAAEAYAAAAAKYHGAFARTA